MSKIIYIPGAARSEYVSEGLAFTLGDGEQAVQFLPGWTLADVVGHGGVETATEGAHGDPRLVVNSEVWDGPIRRLMAIPRPAEEVAEAVGRRKAEAKAQVDMAAEAARQRFITSGAGQAMVYQQKVAEARAFQAGGTGSFPHLTAEVGITAATAAEVAAVVLAMEAAWLGISAAIEATRLAAKRDLAAAGDLAEVEAVLADLEWPEP